MRFLFFIILFFACKSFVAGAYIPVVDEKNEEILRYEGSYALLIGAWKYTHGYSRLPGVKGELDDVEAVLEEHKFKVERLENPDHVDLQARIKNFILERGSNPLNRLLIFFAGHGQNLELAYGGEPMGYIVPVDAPPPDQNRALFRARALSMEQFGPMARDIESNHALFVLDCCFSGSVLFALERTQEKAPVSKTMARPVRQFITAGEDSKTVPDRSEFAKVFIDGLRGEADLYPDGNITGRELGYYIQKRILAITHEMQEPQYGKIRDRVLGKGDFLFPLRAEKSKQKTKKPGPTREFYFGFSKVQEWLKLGGETNLLQASEKLDRLKTLPGGDPILIARADKDLQDAFRRLYNRPAPPTEEVSLTLEVEPKWVYVYDGGGKYLGNTQDAGMLNLKRESGTTLELVFKKKGFKRQVKSLTLKRNTVLQVRLEPNRKTATSYSSTPSPSYSSSHGAPSPSSSGLTGGSNQTSSSYTNSIGMKFKLIPAGSFTMGSPEWEQENAIEDCISDGFEERNCKIWASGEDRHSVKIAQSFYLGETEVTRGQWAEVMGSNTWANTKEYKENKIPFKDGDSYPVVFVSFEDIREFVKRLNEREDCGRSETVSVVEAVGLAGVPVGCYRLPTEAEWEYAARAGSRTTRFWGNNSKDACKYGNVADQSLKGKYTVKGRVHECDDGYVLLAPVGKFRANDFGLYDMLGNVWEWVLDWYDSGYYGESPSSDPVNLQKASARVFRGGSWSDGPGRVRSALRDRYSPGYRYYALGFRLLRIAPP